MDRISTRQEPRSGASDQRYRDRYSPEQIEKVFQPFEQVADHLTREHEGTGLGLPIAKALIELHGGELVLSSVVGVGTTARLRLPSSRVREIAAYPTARG